MKKLVSILKLQIIDSFTYRGDIFLYSLSGVAHPLIMLAIWLTVINSGGQTPVSGEDFIQYYLFLLVVKTWTGAWAAPFIASDIRLGQISPLLIRPVPHYFFLLGGNIGEKLIKTLYIGPLLIILMILFNQRVPELALWEWGMVGTTWMGAAALTFIADLCIGFTAFWLDDSESVEDGYDLLAHIFSGQLIPIFAFPFILQRISAFLPFRYMLSLPLEILLRRLSPQDLINGVLIQALWIGAGLWLVLMLWRKGLQRYSAVGA